MVRYPSGGTTVYPAFSLSRRAPSLVGMLSISSAPWSAAQESQNALICDPMPSRRCFLTTAIPSMMAACSAKASRICAAWTPLVPVRYMSGFNGQTNVDLSNRFTVFDVSGLSGELRTFGMMVVIDQVWNRVIRNKAAGRRTWLYVDEFHRFFSNQYSAAQFKDIYKRARKYGLGVTGITQNVEEILDLQDAREMLSNSDFLMLLSQNSTDADALCELLNLSEEQRQYFTGVLPGQGLMKIGSAFVPFDGRIPSGGDLYRLYSTSFQEQEGK